MGTHFSYYDYKCVDPFLADCQTDAHTCLESIESNLPVFLPNPRSCESYFLCLGDQSITIRCSPGQHFLPGSNFCVPKEESECEELFPDDPRIPDLVSFVH